MAHLKHKLGVILRLCTFCDPDAGQWWSASDLSWTTKFIFSTAHLGVLEPQGIQVIHINLSAASPHLGHHLSHKRGGQQLELPHQWALRHLQQLLRE